MQTPDEKDERIERQVTRIKHLKAENRNAKNCINLLEDEKAELTTAYNKLAARNEFLEGELKYYKHKTNAEVWF